MGGWSWIQLKASQLKTVEEAESGVEHGVTHIACFDQTSRPHFKIHLPRYQFIDLECFMGRK